MCDRVGLQEAWNTPEDLQMLGLKLRTKSTDPKPTHQPAGEWWGGTTVVRPRPGPVDLVPHFHDKYGLFFHEDVRKDSPFAQS